ncbi:MULTISPECIES: head-tail connector protein [Novosphingobium]|uniref:head-tail connector protein n=1 Tax=Novosphingobium TaxID=165696 RepID=UPI001CD7A1B4|nr:hypothetical protein [Novosphingobium percolationis]MCH7629047.1 hypothetical protein [Pseudomonadota bacterium]
MKRAIVAPPSLAPAALLELKAWLGISSSRDDAELTALIMAALDLCEGFTGAMPLQSGCEEILATSGEWQSLSTRPVQAITGAAALSASGQRTALGAGDYDVDLTADGTGLFRLRRATDQTRVAVTFTAGMATGWAGLPDALRQGIMRLAAHEHRRRDADKPGEAASPPAAIAALWRPWRRMRLA